MVAKKQPRARKTAAEKKTAKAGNKRSQSRMNDKPEKESSESAAQDALTVDKSLETVRDILFGAQVREANRRDKELEDLIRLLEKARAPLSETQAAG